MQVNKQFSQEYMQHARKCKLIHSMSHQRIKAQIIIFRFMELELAMHFKYEPFRPMVIYYTQTDYYPFDLSKLDRVLFLNNLKTLILCFYYGATILRPTAKLTFCNLGRIRQIVRSSQGRPSSCTPSSQRYTSAWCRNLIRDLHYYNFIILCELNKYGPTCAQYLKAALFEERLVRSSSQSDRISTILLKNKFARILQNKIGYCLPASCLQLQFALPRNLIVWFI